MGSVVVFQWEWQITYVFKEEKKETKESFWEYLSNMDQIYHSALNNYKTGYSIWNKSLQTLDERKHRILIPDINEIMRWDPTFCRVTAWRQFPRHNTEEDSFFLFVCFFKKPSQLTENRRQRTESPRQLQHAGQSPGEDSGDLQMEPMPSNLWSVQKRKLLKSGERTTGKQ